MRRLLPALIVIVVAVSLLAQTSPPSGKAGLPDSSCVVSGRVIAAADVSPLKSARLTMVPEQGGRKPQLYTATTDSDGRFLLKDVPPGRYRFAASHPRFVTQSYKAMGTDDGALLWLRPGAQVNDVLFRMIVSGVITGRLTNEDGEPMVRVLVNALQEPSEEALEDEGALPSGKRKLQTVSAALTDDRGQYRIFGLNPGEYYLKAVDSSELNLNTLEHEGSWIRDVGSEYAPAYYPGVAQASQAEMISVKAGDEVQADFFIQRTRTATIAGHVIGKDGPGTNAWVSLILVGGEDSWTQREAATDEKGRFELKGVSPGSYLIVAFQSGEDNAYGARGQQKLEVNGENIDGVSIFVGGGITLQGRVTVDGASPLKLDRIGVGLIRVDDEEQFSVQSGVKKDGTFEIKSVTDGNYRVQVSGLDTNWCVKSVRFGGDDIVEKGLQMEKGGSGGRIEILVSSKTAQLDGSVSDGDTPIVGARVHLAPETETPYNRFLAHSIRTDQTGHFSFIGLAPGKYRVLGRYGSSAEGSALRSEPQIVTLSEQDHKTMQLAVGKAQ
jgi:protocatechuate 3,4-dioxygenase beta subunit